MSIGDPIVPSPALVSVPRLLGGEPITLNGYPLHMVHAEKVVTAIQRGVANTRWRDLGDIWSCPAPTSRTERIFRWRSGQLRNTDKPN